MIFFVLSLSLFLAIPLVSLTSRVNLDPSKRQGSNKSVSGCTLPQGSKTVSKFPCLQLYACLLPVSLHVCLSWHLACPYVPFEILPVNRIYTVSTPDATGLLVLNGSVMSRSGASGVEEFFYYYGF